MWRFIFVLASLVALSLGCFRQPDECTTSADCDDGIWCNGEESCRHESDAFLLVGPGVGPLVCVRGGNPCCRLRQGLSFCDTLCVEDEQTCLQGNECQSHEDCDDDLACNGAESCELGFCLTGIAKYDRNFLDRNPDTGERFDGTQDCFQICFSRGYLGVTRDEFTSPRDCVCTCLSCDQLSPSLGDEIIEPPCPSESSEILHCGCYVSPGLGEVCVITVVREESCVDF